MEALEQRVSRLYQYIGDPSGDVFATAKQVQRLETICHEQQRIIQKLQSQQELFQTDAATYFEQQLNTIINQKGIRNTDFIALTKFFTQSLVHAVTTVQTECSDLIQSSLPLSKLQDLEMQMKRLKFGGGNSAGAEKIQELETRLRLLEIQSSPSETENSASHVDEAQVQQMQQTILTLQEHVNHLEDNLITEVQKHYKMTTKQGELAAPLVRVQQMVQRLDQEFQSFRGMDPRKVAEALIQSSTENLRTEFQTTLATRASKAELDRFDITVRRIEAYSTDVQTGFYKMKQQLEDTSKHLTDKFSESRWNRLETKLQQSLETKHKTQLSVWNSVLETQEQKIQETIEGIQRSANRIHEELRVHTSPEAFTTHFQHLKETILDDQQGWLDRIAEPLHARMTTVEKQSQETRAGFLEFTSEMKTELSASGLQKKYATFTDKLAAFEGTVNGWNQRLQKTEDSHKQVLSYVEDRTDAITGSLHEIETQFSEVKQSITEIQKEAKKELAIWLQDRNGDIQKRFTDAAQEIQHIQRSSVALETELYKQLESYRNVERSLAEKFRDSQAKSEQTVVAWRDEQMNYIISRMAEFSAEVRRQLAESEDHLAEYGGGLGGGDSYEMAQVRLRVAELQERLTEINQRTGQAEMRKLQKDLETALYVSNEEWLKKRADGIMSQHVDVFQKQLDEFNQTLAEDRVKFMKRYELLTEVEKTQIRKLNEGLYKDHAKRLQDMVHSESETIRVELLQKVETQITQHFQAYKTLIEKVYVSAGKTQIGQTPINPIRLEYQSQNKCIYTALFGTDPQTSDTLAQVQSIEGWDFVCFTNMDIQDAKGWKIVHVEPKTNSMALAAKRIKWLSHKVLEDYDIVVWIDAYLAPSIIAADKLYQWITLMKERGAVMFHRQHEKRNCIWDECDAVVKNKRDTPEHVQSVRKLLQIQNMPTQFGLYDTNIMIKFHKDKRLISISERIMHLLEQYTTRDQLIVTFVYYMQKFSEFSTADLMRAFEKTGNHVRIPAY